MEKYSPSLLDRLGWKYERLSDWIRYRTYDKYHIVKTDLEPSYYDKDTILLHSSFSILVAFVESECAWMNVAFDKNRKFRHKLPRIIRNTLFPYADRVSGLAFIDCHITDEYTSEDKSNMGFDSEEKYQAHITNYRQPWQEIRDLYFWWKDVRPNRVDEMDFSGLAQHCDGGSELRMHETPEENAECTRKALLSLEIEEQYAQEDTDMFIRLVKVRRCLWT